MQNPKCKYCGYDVHTSPLVICDKVTAYPLPYKTIRINLASVKKQTEPFKLKTQNFVL